MKVINVLTLSEMCEAALDGEPVFIFRAADVLSLPKLRDYHDAAESIGALNTGRIKTAIERFAEWQLNHPTKVKVPD